MVVVDIDGRQGKHATQRVKAAIWPVVPAAEGKKKHLMKLCSRRW
jgi:hypothetical protein